MLFLIDGLDEVALGDQEVKGLFRRMEEQASATRRSVVFTRPAVLQRGEYLKNVPVLNLRPLRTTAKDGEPVGQVGDWLKRWSSFTNRDEPLTAKDLKSRALLDIAETPILLFMIAHTWDHHKVTKPALGDIYEASSARSRGKYEKDIDQNKPIAEASRHLRDRLIQLKHLASKSEPPDAMLWLMGRVAWKMKCLEDAEWLEGQKLVLDTHGSSRYSSTRAQAHG